MIEYAKFILKRILKRKSNIVLIISVILILLCVLVLNMNTQRLSDNLINQKQIYEEFILDYNHKLSTVPKNSEEYETMLNERSFYETLLESNQSILNAYENEDWKTFYPLYIEELNMMNELRVNAMDESQIQEVIKGGENFRQLAYVTYLKDHDLSYMDEEFPVFGLNFMTSVSDIIAPVLILICCVYILSQVFTLDYKKDIDLSTLLPLKRKSVFLTKFFIGIMISIIVFLTITGSAFFLASLCNFSMGFSYPFIIYTSGVWIASSMASYVLSWLLLGTVFFIFTGAFTYVLSFIIKEDITLFITALFIILCLSYLPMLIRESVQIMQYLPTTYLNYLSITTGRYAEVYANANINFTYGLFILFSYTVLFFITGLIKTYIGK